MAGYEIVHLVYHGGVLSRWVRAKWMTAYSNSFACSNRNTGSLSCSRHSHDEITGKDYCHDLQQFHPRVYRLIYKTYKV